MSLDHLILASLFTQSQAFIPLHSFHHSHSIFHINLSHFSLSVDPVTLFPFSIPYCISHFSLHPFQLRPSYRFFYRALSVHLYFTPLHPISASYFSLPVPTTASTPRLQETQNLTINKHSGERKRQAGRLLSREEAGGSSNGNQRG